jgi:hypothetical protein
LALIEEGKDKIEIKKINYHIYASYSKFDLRRQSRCSIKGKVIEKKV